MQDYGARNPISFPQSTPGTITMDILGPGWDIMCTNGSSPYQLMSTEDWIESYDDETNNMTYQGPAQVQTMFYTTVALDSDSSGIIWVNSSYKSTRGVNGTLSWHGCTLSEAIIRYPVKVIDDIITLQPMPLSENRTEYMVYRKLESGGWGSTFVSFSSIRLTCYRRSLHCWWFLDCSRQSICYFGQHLNRR